MSAMTEPMNDERALAILDAEIRSLPTLAAMITSLGSRCDATDAVTRLQAAQNHIAARLRSAAEPVAETYRLTTGESRIDFTSDRFRDLPAGTKLYASAPRPDPPEVDEATRRDAERYRFIRQAINIPNPEQHMPPTPDEKTPETFDAWIDAALTAALKPAAGSV
jgi:hypothetical protein